MIKLIIKPHDVYFEDGCIFVTYRIDRDPEETIEEIKEWANFDKDYSGLIDDITDHNDYIILHFSHCGNEVTFKEIKEQENDLHSWFDEWKHPPDERFGY